MNRESLPFDGGAGGKVGHGFIRPNVLRPTIGIAGIINGVRAEKNIVCAGDFGIRQRERQQDGIARGHVGYGNAGRDTASGHGNVGIRQCRAAETAKIDFHHAVRRRPQHLGHARGRHQLRAMTLAVIHRQAMAGVALLAGQGQHGGGIQSAGKQDHSGFHGAFMRLRLHACTTKRKGDCTTGGRYATCCVLHTTAASSCGAWLYPPPRCRDNAPPACPSICARWRYRLTPPANWRC